jgi:DNA-directed RNA polymerase subunit K/omega
MSKAPSYFDGDSDADTVVSEEQFDQPEDSGDESLMDDLSEDSDNGDKFNLDDNFNDEMKEEVFNEVPNEIKIDSDDDFEVDDDDQNYLQKFTLNISESYLQDNHPECIIHNNIEIDALSSTVRDDAGMIIDKNHQTLPILTKYERTRVLGERAKQINNGAKPYVDVLSSIIDGYIIAEEELYAKKIPFIIQRPLPNGSKEFWKLTDLEIIE